MFYNLNGWAMNGDDIGVKHLAEDAASGQRDEEAVAVALRSWARPLFDDTAGAEADP